jgi:hypothetical protein
MYLRYVIHYGLLEPRANYVDGAPHNSSHRRECPSRAGEADGGATIGRDFDAAKPGGHVVEGDERCIRECSCYMMTGRELDSGKWKDNGDL